MPTVDIRYHRPPYRRELFRQELIHQTPDVVVTYMGSTAMDRPLHVDGRIVLEAGAPVVWFTFPGAWHDIGRFHTADGRFTGIYANILTPVQVLDSRAWETTDLFLDVFVTPTGAVHLLDSEELAHAEVEGWIDVELAVSARREAGRLLQLARGGYWPPSVVEDWPLDRVRAVVGG